MSSAPSSPARATDVAAAGGAPLLARQRQELILDRIGTTGGVRVADVVEALDVSEMTVRRDISELVAQGLVERVHGGAVAAGHASVEPRFAAKSGLHREAKERIAAAALALVRPGDAIALSAGTTTLALARTLASMPELASLTVITNSLPAAQVLFDAADSARAEGAEAPRVILTGGMRTPSNALVGPVAVDALASLRVETAFLGAHGLSAEAGLMTPNLEEAATNRGLVASARTRVALVDASKWGVLGLSAFCPPERLDVVVTDAAPPQDEGRALASHGTRLVLAP